MITKTKDPTEGGKEKSNYTQFSGRTFRTWCQTGCGSRREGLAKMTQVSSLSAGRIMAPLIKGSNTGEEESLEERN